MTYYLAFQCHREERAGCCEPAAGFWHRRPPRRPRHLPPHHLPRQVLNEDYNGIAHPQPFQECHRHHPSLLSVTLSQGKQE